MPSQRTPPREGANATSAAGSPPELRRRAVISRCGRYRYLLERCWDDAAPRVVFIGLNPSTADGQHDDATARVCMGFARRWGCGSLWLVNLFAYRATLPRELLRADTPVGPRNDRWLRRALADASLVVCAWGRHGAHRGRDRLVLDWCERPMCLRQLVSGAPGHPLYVPAGAVPVQYVDIGA